LAALRLGHLKQFELAALLGLTFDALLVRHQGDYA
jgi:hypothetical protein